VGQAVAKRLGYEVVDDGASDPLWVYVLKEASIKENGRRLGPTGARIVVEVLIGLLSADPRSYYACCPNWSPPDAKKFDLARLLQMSGAPMTRGEWYARRKDDESRRIRLDNAGSAKHSWVVPVPEWKG
jgi:hypothetical protein